VEEAEHHRHVRLLTGWSREDELLGTIDWAVVYAFLVGVACEQFRGCRADCVVCGVGVRPRDVAWDVCVAALHGEFRWDGRAMNTGTMCGYLRTVLKRDIVDLLRVRTTTGAKVILDVEQPAAALGDADQQRQERKNAVEPVDPIHIQEGDGSIRAFLEDLAVRPDPHPLFPAYVRLMLRNRGLPPREAAERLGITVPAVNEMNRRLKRRMRRFWTENELTERSRSRRPRNTR
jgi:DNA-directed RNA polymerase specialized sigma24 family protein